MSACQKRQSSKDCLYHLYIAGAGDIQYSLKIPHPYTQTFREIIQRALADILNLRARRQQDESQIQSFHNLANSFPLQYLNTHNTANILLYIGPKMTDPLTQDIETQV
eukprot:466_1